MIELVVEGPPPRKNRRTRTPIVGGRVRHVATDRWKAWRAALALAATLARAPRITTGRWLLRVRVFEAQRRRLDVDVAHGDVDSAISCVLDGLQRVLVLDDDARVVAVICTKHHDPQRPRVEIELRPWTDEAPAHENRESIRTRSGTVRAKVAG